MQSAFTILEQRRHALETQSDKCLNRTSSIENIGGNKYPSNDIDLPAEIRELVTGTDYWVRAKTNRYKKLIREGHLDKLTRLAQIAHERSNKTSPANYFAKACSVAQWETKTLPYLAKLAKVVATAARVVQKLGGQISEKVVYKFVWAGANVDRWADAALEVSHAKPGQGRLRHFNWLCSRELKPTLQLPR